MTFANQSLPRQSLPRLRPLTLPAPLVAPLVALPNLVLRTLLLAHRRLMLRQRLEVLPDRLLRDIGIEREDLPEVIRRGETR